MADSAKNAGIPVFALSLALTNRAARSAVQLLSADAGEQLLEDADLRDEATSLLHRLFGHGLGRGDGRDRGRSGRYRFHLQNGGQGREGDTMVNLWLSSDDDGAADGATDAVDNAAVLQRLKNWTLVLMGTSKPRRRGEAGSDFLVIDLVALPPWSVESLADTVPAEAVFDWGGRHASGIPDDVMALIRTLPPRRLPRNRLRMLLSDWERFLKISEGLAEAKTFVLNYTGYRLEPTGRTVRFAVTVPEGFDRRKVRAAAKEQLHLDRTPDAERVERAVSGARKENHQNANDRSQVIGAIEGLQGTRLTVTLDKRVAARIAGGDSVLPKKGRLAYKALGELAQVRRLRWGLESLLRGRSRNPRLGDFLFDANEAGLPDSQIAIRLSRDELLQPRLNEGQLRAVEGALNAPDLYLIQGPPGTGKTTVIAEICYQVAMRGGRTMVASQANLAVDHAMSRLVHHPSIRALRRGRAERVEEEGKPYLEDYVIGTWLDKVAEECRRDLDTRRSRLGELAHFVDLRAAVDAFDAARARYGSESRPLKAAVRQAKSAHQAATLSLSSAQALRTELQETGQFLADLRTVAEDADGAALDVLARPTLSADAWARVWEPAVREGLQTLQALEQTIETWIVPAHGVAGTPVAGEAPDADPDALDGRVFTSYVRRSRSAAEMASRIAARAADAAPRVEVLAALCEVRYALVAREQPMLDRQRARRMVPSGRRARMAETEATIARHEAAREDLDKLERSTGQVHREISAWLLRRATAEGPVSEVPQGFQTGVRREIWEAAVRGQRLPSLRGVAARARQGRDAADTLGRMASQIDRCVDRLLSQVPPGVLAAAEQGPPSWRESGLANLVAIGADGILRPAPGAESSLHRFLQSTLTLATASDPLQRIPERRVAVNIVGLRGMATDLRASRQALAQAAGAQAEELQSVVERLAAALAANLRATAIAQQRRLTVTVQTLRGEIAGIGQELAAIRTDHTEEDMVLERLARDKTVATGRIENALNLGVAGDLVPFQRLHQVAADSVAAAREVWEHDWQRAQDALGAARAALETTEAALDPDAVLASWARHGEAALASAEEECAAAEAGVASLTEELARAEEALAELEDTYSEAREAWLADYETLPEAVRPETQSSTSSATLELVRKQSELWADEREMLRTYLDSYTGFISDWASRVASRNQRDEADLRQIYIDNANVIGITCVQAGARAFSERYRDFDTVIIDEVSKATPPELLLPMLKGAKVVLVGDSRQLPPMIGPAALQDLAESLEVGARALAHLERSLFRDLFERSPVKLKSWLTDQYRMHPQIMDAINQFYNEKLVCRIESPDTDRAHHLEPLIPASTHIAWIPTPWSEPFHETRVGTSRRNDKEVEIIGNLVDGINELWARGPRDRPPKEIGVITFYAAQERALRGRLLDRTGEQHYEHLDVRLGTVDRFQGMEKPVIIVSLVCNNSRRDIGFAKALERINVAFSRAQELLVIVGSRELFSRHAAAAHATERYGRVAEVVSRSGGDLNVSDFITR